MSNIFNDFNLGISQFKQWQFEKSEKTFRKCIENDSRFDPAVFMLGLSQLMKGKFRNATESFKRFLLLAEKQLTSICISLARYKLGLSQKLDEQFKDAIITMGKGLSSSLIGKRRPYQLVGGRPFAFEEGLVYMELENPDHALDCFKIAEDLSVLGDFARIEIAQYLNKKKENERHVFNNSGVEFAVSVGEIGNLVRFYTDAAVAYHKALCLEQLGRSGEAKHAYSEVRRLNPSYNLIRFDQALIEKINLQRGYLND